MEKIVSQRPRPRLDKWFFNGKIMKLTAWAKELKVDRKMLAARYYRLGWSVEKTLSFDLKNELSKKKNGTFDKRTLRELFFLYKQLNFSGISELAKRYGVHHTTILYHLKRAGIFRETIAIVGKKHKREMKRLFKSGKSVKSIAKFFGFNRTVVEYYCMQSSILPSKALSGLPILSPSEARSKLFLEDSKTYGEADSLPKHKIDDRGVEWRSDGRGGWICVGRQEKLWLKNKAKEEQERLKLKREKMLSY